MLDHFKAFLAVAGGVAGVSGGAVGLALRKTSIQEAPAGGGDTTLVSSSETVVAREVTESLVSSESEDTSAESSVPESFLTQDTELVQGDEVTVPATSVKEKEENCEVIDFPWLNDVFYNLTENKDYILVSCTKTNKDIDISKKFPNQWKGLFPSDLLLKGIKEFKLTTETTVSGEEVKTIFSGESLSPNSVTGKWNGIFRAIEEGETFQAQEIDLEESKKRKIFLFLVENIESLRRKRLSYSYSSFE